MRYTYWINFNKGSPSWSEFWPNEEAIATKERPDGKEFYREGIDELKIKRAGPGKNSGQDNITVYDILETWFTDKTKFNDEIEIEIYRGSRAGTLYYKGFFSVSDSSINKEYSIFNIVPRIDDDYRDFVDEGEAEHDVITRAGRNWLSQEDIIAPIPEAMGAWIVTPPGMNFDDDFNTFTVGGTNNNLTSVIDSDGAETQARYVNVAGLSIASGDVIVLIVKNYVQNAANHPFIDILSSADGSSKTTGAVLINSSGTYILRVNAVSGNALTIYTTPANQLTNFSCDIDLYYAAGGAETNSGRVYIDFIEDYIVNAMGLAGYAGAVKSTFLNTDALPSDAPSSISSFMASYPSGNYASENQSSNPLKGFIISETHNWVDADVTEINISFNQLMNDLMETLQAGWYIDADGDFRIEHIKYFEALVDDSTAIDLTGATYDKYKAETDAREFNFNKALLANREQFRWQQVDTSTNSEDFVGVDIIYDNLETISNVVKHEPRSVTTDIRYLIDEADSASADGLTYLQCFTNAGDYIIQAETGVLSGDDVSNGHFSWANLQDKYWTWRRMSENGDMNDGDTVAFDSAVKFLEQSNLKFGLQTTLSGFTKITTTDGTGQQIKTIRNLDTDFLTILLAYNPY